ncbi:GTP cyclohydrolase I FolE [Knoellia sp. p5-6-4]|uniref:GTP cyclohydrolase I FolE n=1 Tax=unclassified Knoellia TaxID=2618719 RepID=UPI0023DA1FA3|nr:GTP cyclohydrolase I FolE [Knoellia sp. p5-6-4]MDF2143514.1 GTP cyclohydrolase I FolE [Knoellia sp. p5-6-4]
MSAEPVTHGSGGRALRGVAPGPRPHGGRPGAAAETATSGARLLLSGLGIDLTSESLQRTPERMAGALSELLTPRPFELTTFPNDGGYDELIVARGIPMRSLCEHHMLPFVGTAHIGYLPGERILGLSKLARVLEHFSRRPQVQERLTTQVAGWLQEHLQPTGVGVVIEAEHFCMTLRGVQAPGTTTITSSLLGSLRTDARSRAEFLALTHGPR